MKSIRYIIFRFLVCIQNLQLVIFQDQNNELNLCNYDFEHFRLLEHPKNNVIDCPLKKLYCIVLYNFPQTAPTKLAETTSNFIMLYSSVKVVSYKIILKKSILNRIWFLSHNFFLKNCPNFFVQFSKSIENDRISKKSLLTFLTFSLMIWSLERNAQ